MPIRTRNQMSSVRSATNSQPDSPPPNPVLPALSLPPPINPSAIPPTPSNNLASLPSPPRRRGPRPRSTGPAGTATKANPSSRHPRAGGNPHAGQLSPQERQPEQTLLPVTPAAGNSHPGQLSSKKRQSKQTFLSVTPAQAGIPTPVNWPCRNGSQSKPSFPSPPRRRGHTPP